MLYFFQALFKGRALHQLFTPGFVEKAGWGRCKISSDHLSIPGQCRQIRITQDRDSWNWLGEMCRLLFIYFFHGKARESDEIPELWLTCLFPSDRHCVSTLTTLACEGRWLLPALADTMPRMLDADSSPSMLVTQPECRHVEGGSRAMLWGLTLVVLPDASLCMFARNTCPLDNVHWEWWREEPSSVLTARVFQRNRTNIYMVTLYL